MNETAVGQAVELTEAIMGLVEGESPEVLREQLRLLKYHMAIKAGAVQGTMSVAKVMEMEELDK